MPLDVPPPTEVLTLVFGAWALGTIAFALWSRTWGEIQSGHFKVMWLVSAGLAAAAGWGIVAGALDPTAEDGAFALAAAALLGAVTNAMLLGHWHLNQPRLGTRPILRLVYALWAALALYAAATAALIATGDGVTVFAAVTALAFTVFAGVLTAMVHQLVRTRSIMSATGILYLELLLAFVAAFTGSLGALAR